MIHVNLSCLTKFRKMKKVVCILLFLSIYSAVLSQGQNIVDDNYQIGMLNQSSSKKGFIFNLKKKKIGLKVSTLPFFSKGHKVYSSLGVSGLFDLKTNQYASVYSYAGAQRITTKIGRNKSHLNLGVGVGLNAKVKSSIELICQVGYSSLNSFKSNQLTTVVSELGLYYRF